MARKLKYTSNIKDMGLLSKELMQACEMFHQGLTYDEIVADSEENNIFQVNTERRRRELAACIVKRMKYLDEKTISEIACGTIFLSNVMSVYSIMKTNPLMFDFMNEVYKEKTELMINRITDADINQFMDCKAQENEIVAKWKTGNVEKVKGAIRNILVEAGLLRDMGSFYMILVPVLTNEMVLHLQEIDGDMYLRAMGVAL
ncbi:DUF1819 family protein [Faecalimonas sp.]